MLSNNHGKRIERKINDCADLEHKSFRAFESGSIDENGVIKGYASVFGVIDDHNDIVQSGAFKNSLMKKARGMPKMLWQHDMEQPIGYWSKIEEDDYGLYVEGKLLLDLQQAKEAYSLIKSGAVEGLSIGYIVKDQFKCSNTGIRHLKQLELLEVSLVTMPANPKAKVTSCKSREKLSLKVKEINKPLLKSFIRISKVLSS